MAMERPEQQAVSYPCAISYRQLLANAESLAEKLTLKGIGAGDYILVWTQQPLEGVIGLLAALLCGATYIPLDPKAPPDRFHFVASDAKAAAAIIDKTLLPAVPADCQLSLFVADREAPANQPLNFTTPSIDADDAIYTIYTSGSTGTPKGVLISHDNINHFIEARNHLYGAAPTLMPLHPPSFDPAQGGYLWTLASGGCLVLVDHEQLLDTTFIARLMSKHAVSHISVVPLLYNQLLDVFQQQGTPPAFRYCLSGGEALGKPLVEKHYHTLKNTSLYNEYGPTEATVLSTAYRVPPDCKTPIPIGKPVYENGCWILDNNFKPVPQGEYGELFICGPNVGVGYLGNPTLTAEKFLSLSPDGNAPRRFYRSGDRVRLNEENLLEFAGRFDTQIKLRGNRIEPGEIEAVAMTLEQIKSAAVVKEGSSLQCFYSTTTGKACHELREYLADKLPPYMVPTVFQHLPEMPLNSAGKIDRRALTLNNTTEKNGELTETAKQLASIWCNTLELSAVEINNNDDFFALGGNSLLFIKIQNRLRNTFNVNIELSALYQHSTLSELAEHIERCSATQPITTVPSGDNDCYPIAPVQEIFFYLSEIAPESSAYIEVSAAKIKGSLKPEKLIDAIKAVVAKHEILRAQIQVQQQTPHLSINHNINIEIPVFNVSEEPENLPQNVSRYLKAPFNLYHASLCRFCLVTYGPRRHQLFFSSHHIIIDGISIARVFDQIGIAYRQPEVFSATPAIPYRDFAVTSRAGLTGDTLATLKQYWRTVFSQNAQATEFPRQYLDETTHERSRAASATVKDSLPEKLNREIKALCAQLSLSPFMFYLAVLSLLLHRLTQREQIILGTPVSVRQREEWEDGIGCFINTMALSITLNNPMQRFSAFSGEVRKSVLQALEHSAIPFHWIKEDALKGDTFDNDYFKFFLNYIDHVSEQPASHADLVIEPVHQHNSDAKFNLNFYIHAFRDHTEFEVVFAKNLYSNRAINVLLTQMKDLLNQAILQPDRTLASFSLATRQPQQRFYAQDFPVATRCLQDSFFEHAQTNPERTAIIAQGVDTCYGELAVLALTIKADIAAKGIAPGQRIAVFLPRSRQLCASLIGILDTGCIFTVLDPAQPIYHNKAVLEQFNPSAIIATESDMLKEVISDFANLPIINPPDKPHHNLSRENPTTDISAPAYAVFTSGTTGKPKGVLATHAPAQLFVDWQRITFGLGWHDHFAMLSGLSHDPLIRDIFTPLSIGATLHIPDEKERKEPSALAAWLKNERITVSHLTPSLAKTLFSQNLTTEKLRYLFLGGERLSYSDIQLMRQTAPNAFIINCYGTTETPQIISYQDVTYSEALTRIPIGRGNPQFQIRVVNPNGEPCGIGEPGEIRVISPYLGLGYITPQGYQPFTQLSETGIPEYRTGDTGCYDINLNIQPIDRIDRQVKINGYRIELAAMELAIRSLPDIKDVRVCNIPKNHTDNYLAAFVVLSDNSNLKPTEIRRFLQPILIAAAIPSVITFVKQLPLTANGKVDERQLIAGLANHTSAKETIVEPRTQTEEVITQIWREVLNTSSIGVNTDFFESGGDSVLAVKALIRLNEYFQKSFSLEFFVNNASPAKLATAISREADFSEESLLVKINEKGRKPPFWMLHPVGGHVTFARRFSQALGSDWPIYGIQARGLDGKQKPLYTISDMALHYIQLIRSIQPQGPYNLGGPSMGGRIAFEIAQQLIACGETVDKLILFDSWAQGFPPKIKLHKWLLTKAKIIFNASLFKSLKIRRKTNTPFGYADYQIGDIAVVEENAVSNAIQSVIEANQIASRSYLFSRYPGNVILFSAQTLPDWPEADFSDLSKGWHLWANNVQIINIESTHQHIMDEPALTQVVREFKKLF